MSSENAANFREARGFCDLNIPWDPHQDLEVKKTVKRVLQLGYETIALNVAVNQSDLTTKTKQQKNKKAKFDKQLMTDFPAPPSLKLDESDYVDLSAKSKKPVILSRLTITFENNDFLPIFKNSETAHEYDILALCPRSGSALINLLKSSFRADLICFDPANCQDVRWDRKLYNECVEKHMFFELPYAPAITNSETRRRIIAQSHNYHAVGKSKNIVVTSGALSPIEVRGPFDVANLGFLFGLNETQGKLAVRGLCADVVRAAAGRKLGPFRAVIQKVEDLEDGDKWKVPKEEGSEEGSEESSEEESDELEVME